MTSPASLSSLSRTSSGRVTQVSSGFGREGLTRSRDGCPSHVREALSLGGGTPYRSAGYRGRVAVDRGHGTAGSHLTGYALGPDNLYGLSPGTGPGTRSGVSTRRPENRRWCRGSSESNRLVEF